MTYKWVLIEERIIKCDIQGNQCFFWNKQGNQCYDSQNVLKYASVFSDPKTIHVNNVNKMLD
jgi:hypothetical protein